MADRRVLKTKKALRQAFLTLVAEHGYEPVSVQAIVARADVGRATFYAHYADKEDLLIESLEMLGDHLRDQIAAQDACEAPLPLRFGLPVFRHIQEAGDNFFTFQEVPALEREFRQVVSSLAQEHLDDSEAGPASVLAEALTGGLLALAKWWRKDARELTPEEINERFLELFGSLLPDSHHH